MTERWVLLGIVIAALSGVPGLFLNRKSVVGAGISTLLAVIAAAVGLYGVGIYWATGISQPIIRPWAIPGAQFHVAMDGLSALFLVPIFLMLLVGSVYGWGYWSPRTHSENGRKLRLFYGSLSAGMALLVIARNSILFMVGWEVMALSAFFLVTTEDRQQSVHETGWIYLVATKIATVSLLALFALLRSVSGSFTLAPLPENALTPGIATAIFVFTLIGFGIKAGIMPLHVWLPSSHAIAPSHVSAVMSGVIIKMGIYGIVRIMSLIPHPPVAWGVLVLSLGTISGVLGVAFAIGQHDLKRLLAYHSIENIGIIVMGIGLALIGKSLHRPEWILLGLSGGLLHVWNHAIFKSLLFLSAGSVINAVHSREIDHLGGLAKRMPQTAICFVVGAVAICGLPPLNGFVSEFLIYLGLFGTLGIGGRPSFAEAAFAAPALALIGALAVACFVKVFGVVFLGTARSEHARLARESGPSMIGAMYVLVVLCFFVGLAPMWVGPVLEQAVNAWIGPTSESLTPLATLAPLGSISAMALTLIALLVVASAGLWWRMRSGGVAFAPTWGCGFAAPTPRMQYTSSSFAEMLVGLFGWALRPRIDRVQITELLPPASSFHSEVRDPVLDELVLPAFRFSAWLVSWFRVFQQGKIQAYLLYMFVALVALLLWR